MRGSDVGVAGDAGNKGPCRCVAGLESDSVLPEEELDLLEMPLGSGNIGGFDRLSYSCSCIACRNSLIVPSSSGDGQRALAG